MPVWSLFIELYWAYLIALCYMWWMIGKLYILFRFWRLGLFRFLSTRFRSCSPSMWKSVGSMVLYIYTLAAEKQINAAMPQVNGHWFVKSPIVLSPTGDRFTFQFLRIVSSYVNKSYTIEYKRFHHEYNVLYDTKIQILTIAQDLDFLLLLMLNFNFWRLLSSHIEHFRTFTVFLYVHITCYFQTNKFFSECLFVRKKK